MERPPRLDLISELMATSLMIGIVIPVFTDFNWSRQMQNSVFDRCTRIYVQVSPSNGSHRTALSLAVVARPSAHFCDLRGSDGSNVSEVRGIRRDAPCRLMLINVMFLSANADSCQILPLLLWPWGISHLLGPVFT